MVSFEYLIKDEMGLHVRPVSRVVKAVKPFKNTKIMVSYNGKKADLKKIFAVIALQVNCGETVIFTVEGEEEVRIAEEIKGILASFLNES
jgi:phosphocarrier protein HPr